MNSLILKTARPIALMLAVSGVVILMGCAGGQATLKTPPPAQQSPQASDAERAAREREEAERRAKEEAERAAREAEERARVEAEARAREAARQFENIYFDYDRYNIRDDQKSTLAMHVEKLKANPDFKVTIEGHCDERGTIEYNMALGQRRAESARKFLVKVGIDAYRLTTISYGKERPVDPGHDETAWSRNRRAEFKVTEPPTP